MADITLKQLRYFESLVRHGHFGRAAEAASVSQPALSVQIKDLEESLGTVLFERGPRQVRLTSFGEVFAERARDILRAVDEVGDLARGVRVANCGVDSGTSIQQLLDQPACHIACRTRDKDR